MEKLIGREKEAKVLMDAYEGNGAQFLAVYGRRRVGKTFLIKSLFAEKMTFEMTGVNDGVLKTQLKSFSAAIKAANAAPQFKEKTTNWFDAFQLLKAAIEQSTQPKKVIFFDELPWIDTPKSGFLSALEHFWNSWAAFRSDILLIICGSSASWMIRKIINNKGGLYNRITGRIRLLPFNLYETEQYLNARNIFLDRYQIVELYMVMGGIPHYLKHIKMGQSATQTIDAFCFEKDGILYNEFTHLYQALFDSPDKHLSIITALASKRKGLTRLELLQITGLPNAGSTTRILEELEESSFIEKYMPMSQKIMDNTYRLTDYYSFFYLKYIQNNKIKKAEGVWQLLSASPSWHAWSGYAFENICLQHSYQIKKALGINGMYALIGNWQLRGQDNLEGTQIDMLIDRADKIINLCEIKFTDTTFDIDKAYADNLKKKKDVFKASTKTKKSVFITMITTYGIHKNKHSIGLVQNDITLDALFERS